MKTIMQVLPSLEQGGVETGTIEIARALQQAKMPNIVVSNGGSMVAQLKKMGVPHFQLPMHSKNPLVILLNAYRLKRILKENHVGLMHVRSRAPAWSVWMASRQTGVPFISSYHGLYGIQPKIKKLYNQVMLKGLCTIAVSECVKKHLIQEYHYPKDKIHVIHRGADLNRFNEKSATKEKILKFAEDHQINLDKPIITLVGRLSKMKGQLLLLQALSKMQHQEITCLLIGGKAKLEYELELKQEIQKLPESVTVQCLSVSATDIPFVYALSDVVVSASIIPETFGRTVAEAGAMQKIVVAFDHGGPQEIIVHNKTGFLIPVGNVDILAKTLDKVLSMKRLEKTKMELAAKNRIVQHFSIQKMCEKTLKQYREILK